MEFKRKITQDLDAWKDSLKSKKKALVIKGLRQIGKSYIVDKYARSNYENVIKIDFKKEPSMKVCFGSDLTVNTIITNISANKPGALFVPHNTVIILDEIQECPAFFGRLFKSPRSLLPLF